MNMSHLISTRELKPSGRAKSYGGVSRERCPLVQWRSSGTMIGSHGHVYFESDTTRDAVQRKAEPRLVTSCLDQCDSDCQDSLRPRRIQVTMVVSDERMRSSQARPILPMYGLHSILICNNKAAVCVCGLDPQYRRWAQNPPALTALYIQVLT